MTSSRHVASHARPPRHAPPSTDALVVGAAVLAAAAALTACSLTASAWPAAVLPVLAVALGGVRVAGGTTAVAAAVLLLSALAALARQPEGAGVGSAVPALGMVAAVLAGAAAVAVWHLQRARSERHLAAERERAQALSVFDDLTGCFNTHGLELLGDHILQLVRRQSGAMHCAVVEVEGVAPVLDGLGASAVEEVLVAVSEALRGATRGSDVVCRSGEVTFLVVGPGTGMGALDLERRLRGALLQAPPLSLREWPCTVVVGVGQLQPWDNGGIADIVARADEDLGLRRALRAPSTDPQATRVVTDPGL